MKAQISQLTFTRLQLLYQTKIVDYCFKFLADPTNPELQELGLIGEAEVLNAIETWCEHMGLNYEKSTTDATYVKISYK